MSAAVISELPEQKEIEGLGATMRLGGQDISLKAGTMASWLFAGKTMVRERFRHRYEVDPRHIEQLESAGLCFSGRHPKHPIMQFLELPRSMHPYFVGGQFHPELTSRPLHPQPMFMGLLAAAVRRASPGLDRSEISMRWLPEDEGSDDGEPGHAATQSTAACGPSAT